MMKQRFFLMGICLMLLSTVITYTQAQAQTGNINDLIPFVELPLRVTQAGVTVTIDVSATSGDLDTLVYLVNNQNAIIAENDDIDSTTTNSKLVYEQAEVGNYTIVVTRFGIEDGKTSGNFEVTSQLSEPEVDELDYDISPETLEALGYPVVEPKEKADWLIIAYFGGDTNLEPGVMNDFNEFELAGGSNEDVRIVALLDRHPGFVTNNDNWASARLFEIEADVSADESFMFPPTIDSEPLADLGVIDTGNGEVMAQFLTWAIRNYPAENYMIALASHGGAWQGVITDDTNGNTILSLPELREALRLAKEEAGIERFDVLINDACSMSSIEYHSIIEEDFEYSLASPEIVVDPALNMRQLAQLLNEDTDIDIIDLSEALIDTYLQETSATDSLDSRYLSFSLSDLTVYEDLRQSVEAFASYINRNPQQYANLLGTARANTYTYSGFLGSDEQIDLGDFMSQIVFNSTDAEIIDLANTVIEQVDRVKLLGKAADRVQDLTTYTNIYFPQDGADFDNNYLNVTPLQAWGRMLREYYTISAPRLWNVEDSPFAYHPPIAPIVRVTRVYPYQSSTAFPPSLSVEIIGRNIAAGAFTVDQPLEDGRVIRLIQTNIVTQVQQGTELTFANSWKNGVDQSIFQWLPFTLPVVSDGINENLEFMILEDGIANLEGRYRERNSTIWYDIAVLFNSDGSIANTIARSENGAIADVVVPANATFQSYILEVAEDGSTKRTEGNLYDWGENGITWSAKPTPSGEYRLGVRVQAFGGSFGFDAVDILVENTANNALTGYNALPFGINFQVPSDWTDVFNYGNQLNVHNAENTLALNIYTFVAEENVYDIVAEAERRFGLNRTTELFTLSYQGNSGLYFDYTYELESGQSWQGRAIAFYHESPTGGRAIIYALEGRTDVEAPDPFDLFRTQLNRLTFINGESLAAQDTSVWEYRLLNNVIPYPAISSWDEYQEDAWTRLNPENGFEGATYVALAQLDDVNLRDILEEFAPDATNVQEREYSTQAHTWEILSYVITRPVRDSLGRVEDTEIIGRIYTTNVFQQPYVIRFEVPSDNATESIRTIFEPMIDGFAPSVNLTNQQASLLQSMALLENSVCRQIRWNQACSNREVIDLTEEDSLTVDSLGLFNVSILNLQANLPARNEGEYLRVYAFGGTSITNEATPLTTIQIINDAQTSIAIRSLPDSASPQVGSLSVDEVANAVQQSADGEWIRVQIPTTEDQSGWVRAEFVRPTVANNLNALIEGNPELPVMYSYQDITVTFTEDAILQGLVIRTSPTQKSLYLRINGQVYEFIGNSTLVWSSENGELETLSTSNIADIFNPVFDERRPEPFIATVTPAPPERVPWGR
jgi:hypothetical protein